MGKRRILRVDTDIERNWERERETDTHGQEWHCHAQVLLVRPLLPETTLPLCIRLM